MALVAGSSRIMEDDEHGLCGGVVGTSMASADQHVGVDMRRTLAELTWRGPRCGMTLRSRPGVSSVESSKTPDTARRTGRVV